jgi:hypothetical protein
MDKQREEFEKIKHHFNTWQWEMIEAAQAAMQPEIDEVVQGRRNAIALNLGYASDIAELNRKLTDCQAKLKRYEDAFKEQAALSDAEIYKICEDIWKVSNSWGLTYNDFISLSYKHGKDGKGRLNGCDDELGDTVYISESGGELTRAMCHSWCNDWQSFSHGFLVAYKNIFTKPEGE